jgi:membrane protein YqaA with SNARE-associated domain
VKLHPIALLHKFSAAIYLFLIPLGVWGLGGLALLDSALIPIPGSMDGVISVYVHNQPAKFLLYCFMAAAASTIGSLVPFYIGRAGGELVLLKRINRERYERMRDRFERQEFFAIMIPSMGPPPTPLKLFQFAAGIFEMKPALFMLATFCGKMTQYTVWSIALLWLGPTVLHAVTHQIHRHLNIALGLGLAVLLGLIVYVVRRIFDRRKGIPLPVEDELQP